MDGVLIDATEWHYLAFNKALSQFSLDINRNEHLKTFDGLPTKKKLKKLTEEGILPVQYHDEVYRLKQQYTEELINTFCKPIFTQNYALSKLKNMGYHLAVCSNSIRSTVHLMLTKSRLIHYFDFYLSNEDVIKSKPDPEIYQKAISKFKVLPKECLVLEDNHHGIQAAKLAGTHILEIKKVSEVNYANIMTKIEEINSICQ